MKRFISALLLALLFACLFASGASAYTIHRAQGLTGGGATDLDAKDGSPLEDGDINFTFDGTYFYPHVLDDDSGLTENSPDVVTPDTNPGTKRWILKKVYSAAAGVHPPTGVELTGGIAGLNLANGTDADHDIDISAGACMGSTGVYHISSSSTVAKQLDVAWVAYTTPSTPSGGLLNGSIATNTLYHIYALRKDSDGSVDFGFLADGDSIATYLPSGYSYYRWVGLAYTDSSSNIEPFVMNGPRVTFDSPVAAASSVNTSSLTSTSLAELIPSGRVLAINVAGGANSDQYFEFSTGGTVRDLYLAAQRVTTNWAFTTTAQTVEAHGWLQMPESGSNIYVNSASETIDVLVKALILKR